MFVYEARQVFLPLERLGPHGEQKFGHDIDRGRNRNSMSQLSGGGGVQSDFNRAWPYLRLRVGFGGVGRCMWL